MQARPFLVSLVTLATSIALVAFAAPAQAWQAEADALAYTIADGGFSLAAPEGWKRVQPKSSIVETEFSIPSEGEGVQPGRMTVMGAGGSVQANVDRDITGTYKDAPAGPFAGGKAVDRPDYRMLAAIVETPDRGNYFLKFYGPGKTVAKHADGFRAMVEGLVPAGK